MRYLARNPLNRAWFVLIGLTLLTAAIAESRALNTVSVALISLIVIMKGRLIIREYMDMKAAPPLLYWALIVYMIIFSTAMLALYQGIR